MENRVEKYFRKKENPKTGKLEEIEVRKYIANDLVNMGLCSFDYLHEKYYPAEKEGKYPEHIKTIQKDEYNKLVEIWIRRRVSMVIEDFNIENGLGDTDVLLQSELGFCRWKLLGEKPEINHSLLLNHFRICFDMSIANKGHRETLKDKKRDFSKYDDYWLSKRVDVEVLAGYYEYLKGIKAGKRGSKTKSTPKEDITFLELFCNEKEKMDTFFELLRSPKIDAIDDNNNWKYNSRKSSIVACFRALADLGHIKKRNNAELQRIVKTKINFEGSDKLFRCHYNSDDHLEFRNFFERIK